MSKIEYSNHERTFENLCREMQQDIVKRQCMTEVEAKEELKRVLIARLDKELGGK